MPVCNCHNCRFVMPELENELANARLSVKHCKAEIERLTQVIDKLENELKETLDYYEGRLL